MAKYFRIDALERWEDMAMNLLREVKGPSGGESYACSLVQGKDLAIIQAEFDAWALTNTRS